MIKTIFSYLVFFGLCLAIMFAAVIPWPSAIFVLLGICDSSREYLEGECKLNTFSWKWCVTKESVKKMKHSECISTGGLIYYTEKQANNAHQLLINESRPSSEKNGN